MPLTDKEVHQLFDIHYYAFVSIHGTMVQRRVKTVICMYVHICILDKYLLKWNSFSNSSIWCLVYAVLFLFVSDNIESVLVPRIEKEETINIQ